MPWDDLADPQLEDSEVRETTLQRFHALYYAAGEQTWMDTYWLGVPVSKCPLDLWIYQEILHAVRPDVIIETGTYFGGSALFLACVCDLLGRGRVLTVDVEERAGRPAHSRLEYVLGSSISDEVTGYLRRQVRPGDKVLVILDSDHSRDHVLAELERYHGLVSVGSYLIVEDTNVNGHPAYPAFGPGPMEALAAFLPRHPELEVDLSREKLLLTFNPGGYLRKRPSVEARTQVPTPRPLLDPARRFESRLGIERLHRKIAEQYETVDWLHREVATRDQAVASLHREVATRDQTLASLHREVAVRDQAVVSLHREVATRDEELSLLQRQLARADEAAGAAAAELASARAAWRAAEARWRSWQTSKLGRLVSASSGLRRRLRAVLGRDARS